MPILNDREGRKREKQSKGEGEIPLSSEEPFIKMNEQRPLIVHKTDCSEGVDGRQDDGRGNLKQQKCVERISYGGNSENRHLQSNKKK
ncbi:hypothetical protein CEXT_260121 [Caerostris extrusa]|uniref:Uncharacterized protein n=1 Tax=Caerostris extrusa TaxID=172846 RepID=A0AAV4VPS1_CAEEX|nr:hypothetical protein CEXT_260121 [Caerostris extrusa]